MRPRTWLFLILCAPCLLVGCAAEAGSTASGSDEWSRGVVIGATEADTVAAAAWEGTTFVVWIGEGGQLQLTQLDESLEPERVTGLTLSAASVYARDLRLQAEGNDRLHLTWEDSVGGIPTLVHARLVPGQAEPAFRQEISLPVDAHHIETMMRPGAGRLEIFWSAISSRNSGIHHQAVSLTGDTLAPPARLTDTGRQPAVGCAPSGAMHLAWVDDAAGNYVTVWHGRFDPQTQSLQDGLPIAEVWWKRGNIFQGPVVGSTGVQTVVAWSVGRRGVVLGSGDVPTGGLGGVGTTLSFAGAYISAPAVTSIGDRAQYVIVSSSPAERIAAVRPLTGGQVAGVWREPRIRTVGDRTWVVFSGLVRRRSHVLSQTVAAHFDEEGESEPVVVSATRRHSHRPELAAGADGTPRVAWLEAVGDNGYEVVVASAASEALEALGGFRLTDLWGEVLSVWFAGMSLLFYAPMVIGWIVLPLGLVLVVTLVSRISLQGWRALAWLGVVMLLQLACKRFLAPQLTPLQSLVQLGLFLAPAVLGSGLVWVYWRRAERRSLLTAYGLFAAVDAVFSLFVLLPRVLWAI